MLRLHPIAMGVAASALLISGAPARAAVLVNVTTPIDSVLTDDCTGEDVHIQGDVHSLISFTPSARHLHLLEHVNFHDVRGVGLTSGIEYVAADAVANPFTLGREETFVQQTLLVAPGAAPDLILETRFHFTITPDGDVVVDIDEMSTTCHGAG